MQNTGIIFDCDGTLVDSLGAAMESFNYALDLMGEPPRPPEAIKRYFGAGADRILARVLGNEERGLEAFEHYVNHQSELAKRMRLHDGIRELLEALHARGVPMGIVTGRHARDLAVVLAPHKLDHFFGALIADNHLPHSKPAPDGILLACERLRLDPRRTLYIGDSVMDIQAAHAAGSHPVAALWDELAVASAMAAERPAFMANHPRDVERAFEQIFKV